MKVFLLQDVKAVGRKNEIKEVADGYGLNNLLPRKLAVAATPEIIARYTTLHKEELAREEIQNNLRKEMFERLRTLPLILRREANEQGHLFAQIHPEEIAETLSKDHRVKIEPSWIKSHGSIKTIGAHTLKLEHGGAKTEITLMIERKNA